MCSSYLTTMLVTEPASSFSASLRVLHSDGYSVRLHVRVHESWCQSLTLTQPFLKRGKSTGTNQSWLQPVRLCV